MSASIRFAPCGSILARTWRVAGANDCVGVPESASGSLPAAGSAATSKPQIQMAFIATPLPQNVDNHAPVDSVPVTIVFAEEVRRIVLGPHVNESIVAAKPPSVVR